MSIDGACLLVWKFTVDLNLFEFAEKQQQSVGNIEKLVTSFFGHRRSLQYECHSRPNTVGQLFILLIVRCDHPKPVSVRFTSMEKCK